MYFLKVEVLKVFKMILDEEHTKYESNNNYLIIKLLLLYYSTDLIKIKIKIKILNTVAHRQFSFTECLC